MAKKILYIASGRSVRGKDPGRKISCILECWREQGNEVQAIFGGDFTGGTGESECGSQFGNSDHYKKWYRNMKVMEPVVHSASEVRDIRHNLKMLEELKPQIAEFKPDIIWERSFRLHSIGLEMSETLQVPHVLEWKDHLVDYRFSLFHRKALQLEARKNREANHIVVESGVLRDELGREGVDSNKIIVAHNAVKVEQFSCDSHQRKSFRKDLAIEENTVLVGYLGSYAFYHDTERMVLAADIIRKKNITCNIKFLMVGAGKEYSSSRRLAKELNLLDEILIMKPGVPKKEVPGILAALDIAVLPGSTDIICPIKVQEYMAAGLPSVVPDYACNREVIEDGQTGSLFTPHDEWSLAEKICALAKDSQSRERVGHNARLAVEQRFTWESTWGAALEEVIRRA